MDDFPPRLEHVPVLNSQIKCACRVAEAQAHQIQAPSIVRHPLPNFQLGRGVNPPFYLQLRSTSYPKRDFIGREDLDTLHFHFGLRVKGLTSSDNFDKWPSSHHWLLLLGPTLQPISFVHTMTSVL